MLNILGNMKPRLCSGPTRRDAIQIGSLGFAGLTLPQLLRQEANADYTKKSKRSVILIWQHGGPAQLDYHQSVKMGGK